MGDYAIHLLPLCTNESYPRAHLHWMLPVSSDERIRDCHYVWYIEGPGARYLVDAGISAEKFIAKGVKSKHIQTLDEALGKVGLEVSDIDYVILSHAHYDHIANIHRFPHARVIIQRAELEEARNPFPYSGRRLPAEYPSLLEGVKWEVIEGDTRIDDNIELLFTPGHSAGGHSVAVKTAQGRAIITGFCSVQENFDPPEQFKARGYDFTISASHVNPVALYESAKRVIELADLVVPCHEYDGLINVGRIG